MKNHWLDKKIDKEIDKAFEQMVNLDKPCLTNEEFKDTDFIDLATVMDYKEYEKLQLKEELIEKVDFGVDFGVDVAQEEHDRAVVTEILLYYKNEPHWIDKVLSDVGYFPPATLGNLTIDTTNAIMFDATTAFMSEGNFTIKWPDWNTINTPGGDGILGEVKTSEVCNEEMWPMNTATTMGQGDPCSNPCGNLDSWYPDQKFIQNETLQVLEDKGHITTFQTMYTPVIAGTMTGTVYPTPGNRSYGYVFYVSSSEKFNFTRFVTAEDGKVEYANGCSDPWQESKEITLEELASDKFDDRFMGWYDEVYVPETNINLATGVLELHYHMGKCPEIVVSYEYQKVDSL